LTGVPWKVRQLDRKGLVAWGKQGPDERGHVIAELARRAAAVQARVLTEIDTETEREQ
jgi:predicted Fe-S protein YdhL (DUF1289 family)